MEVGRDTYLSITLVCVGTWYYESRKSKGLGRKCYLGKMLGVGVEGWVLTPSQSHIFRGEYASVVLSL
jgi:hypothetical protein